MSFTRKVALIAVAACLAASVAGCAQQRSVSTVATTTADSTRTVTKTPEATGLPLTR